jgi:hypothetical protein
VGLDIDPTTLTEEAQDELKDGLIGNIVALSKGTITREEVDGREWRRRGGR